MSEPPPVWIRCYAELNDRLSPARRYALFSWPCPEGTTVAGLLDALQIPLALVELALVDGRPVGPGHRVHPGAQVSLYPVFEALDVAGVARLRERPLRDPHFLLDGALGKAARLLRLLGFDAQWVADRPVAALVRLALGERRILLTCSRRPLADPALTHGLWIEATHPPAQAAETVARLDLFARIVPFSRCLVCNGPVAPVDKAQVEALVRERVRARFEAFRRCADCGRVYWEGSHHRRMGARVDEIVREAHRLREQA
jgi:hypothetical protein